MRAQELAMPALGRKVARSAKPYQRLLDFLREQEFADKLARVAFKPIIRETQPAKLLAVFVVDTNETELTIPFGN